MIIDHDIVDPALLPDDSAISSITLAELAAGPHATVSDDERARRQDRLQWASTTWDALPFDIEAARAYGRVFAANRAAGRSSRARLADLLRGCADRRSRGPSGPPAKPARAGNAASVSAAKPPSMRKPCLSVEPLIASVAMANGLPLFTRNPSDLDGLEELVVVVTV